MQTMWTCGENKLRVEIKLVGRNSLNFKLDDKYFEKLVLFLGELDEEKFHIESDRK